MEKKNKKGEGLSLPVIIIATLALVVLFVLIAVFTERTTIDAINSTETSEIPELPEIPSKYEWGSLEPQVGHYWTCLDGCYNMQQLYEIEFNITPSLERHTACSEICWGILIEGNK